MIDPPFIGAESLDIDALSPRDQALYVIGVCAAARTYGFGTFSHSPHVVADSQANRILAGKATSFDEGQVREFMRGHLDRVIEYSRKQSRLPRKGIES